MDIDDVIYVLCLLMCVAVGKYVREIRNEVQSKIVCTTFGLLVVLVVSGTHSLHFFLSLTLGICTILFVHASQCHLATFAVMFGYLVFFRLAHVFGWPAPPGHTNMTQMMLTLKLSGLAFEKTAAWKRLQKRMQSKHDEELARNDVVYDEELQKLSPIEIVNYCCNYFGVLTGPYYRYRTYRDYFETPFKYYAPCLQTTKEKLKWSVGLGSLYLLVSYLWPLEYATSDEFYNERSFIYRLFYVWPTFLIFRMRIYTGLTLSECVCTMAGFGAYPLEADATNGEGPRKLYQNLRRDAAQRQYSFITIINTRVLEVEWSWTFREGMKHWNVCVQYWLAVYIYKLFPSKKYRTFVTLFVSSYWHGFRPGHYFCLMGAPFYVPLEDMWIKLVYKDSVGVRRQVLHVIFWIATWFSFSYLGTAFLLASFSNIWRYYSSLYHIGYITWALMLTLGIYLTKLKKRAEVNVGELKQVVKKQN